MESAHIPKELLKSKAVAREINFSSESQIDNFRIVQEVKLHDQIVEGTSKHTIM